MITIGLLYGQLLRSELSGLLSVSLYNSIGQYLYLGLNIPERGAFPFITIGLLVVVVIVNSFSG